MARVKVTDRSIELWASERDTYDWATRPGAAWPCSHLRGSRFYAAFDASGLVDTTVDGRRGDDVPADEFSACCADLLEASGKVPAEHPARYFAIDQHLASN